MSIDSVTEMVHVEDVKFASAIHSSSSVCGSIQDVVQIMEVIEKANYWSCMRSTSCMKELNCTSYQWYCAYNVHIYFCVGVSKDVLRLPTNLKLIVINLN